MNGEAGGGLYYPDGPDLFTELDEAEAIVMGREAPEWWVLLPGAPWGGKTSVLGPYGSEEDARAQVARTRGYAMEAKLLRTVSEDDPHGR